MWSLFSAVSSAVKHIYMLHTCFRVQYISTVAVVLGLDPIFTLFAHLFGVEDFLFALLLFFSDALG